MTSPPPNLKDAHSKPESNSPAQVSKVDGPVERWILRPVRSHIQEMITLATEKIPVKDDCLIECDPESADIVTGHLLKYLIAGNFSRETYHEYL